MARDLSVIIPTLQKSHLLSSLVDQLATHPKVGEVVVVNNAQEPLSYSSSKVRVLNQESNRFVNPSWNIGVRAARNSAIALCNDDISFDSRLIDLAIRTLYWHVGIIGPHPSCFIQKQGRTIFTPVYERTPGFGTIMFMRRQHYLPIPEQLKIWCGDDYLFYRQTHRNLLFRGIPITTRMSTTSNEARFSRQKLADTEYYLQHFAAESPYLRRYSREARTIRRIRSISGQIASTTRTVINHLR